MVFLTSLAVAKQLYPGGRLRIAAQGALQKPGGSYRPLHDATHGVMVNNGIRPRDQLDFPGPADEAATMESSRREGPSVFFGLAADIKQGLQQQFASAVVSAAAVSARGLQQHFASAVVSAAAVSR